ncbi:MAG: S1-like domain-containing RNA-binding protein [Cytophagales bacterium]|nr:S1-like domain-containing RNA-binding protein [Bernardetiaceae bacterium]MDW8205276.1 S1-like domain-containing RNA-binding protein [Cytophagales bacterium]
MSTDLAHIVGRYATFRVHKLVEFGAYLDTPAGEILLPKKYMPEGLQPNDTIEVFIYHDSEDRPIATTLKPYACLGEFACLRVTHTTSFGAFLDWGLEKDLFVPLKEQHRPMREGQVHVVRIGLDPRTNRLIGIGKIGAFLDKGKPNLRVGQAVELLVYEKTSLGYMCIINNQYAGILYHSELFEPVKVGDRRRGFVKRIRSDFKIDLSLRKQGFQGVREKRQVILDALSKANGFLPYHDKTSPTVIKQTFQMSKKTFKILLGNLLKEGRIKISEKGITFADAERK